MSSHWTTENNVLRLLKLLDCRDETDVKMTESHIVSCTSSIGFNMGLDTKPSISSDMAFFSFPREKQREQYNCNGNVKREDSVDYLHQSNEEECPKNEDIQNKTLDNLWQENEQEVFTLKKDYSKLQSRNEELQRQLSSCEQEVCTLKRDCSQLQTRNEDQWRQLNEHKQQVVTLEKDCSQLQTRLSQIAALQLTEGNPNIADLSDQNRPDKLAEQFSELYDNQWTDCYQVLVGDLRKTEEDSIHILLKIVKTSYDICLDGSQSILKITKDILFAFAGRSDGEPDKSLDTLIQEILHKLKSYRTRSFKAAPTNIRKEIKAKLISTIGEPVVDACSCFIEESIRTCWLMCIKDPAMYIFCDKEAVFDKTKYMEYTETGHEVSYVVWPVLYLHKDGPLMRKGVVQGEGRKDRNRNRNVKAASHELPEPDHMQEYYNGIEDTTKRDSDHQANDISIAKENKSEDIESADGSPFLSNIAVISNGDQGNAEKLGYEDHTKTEPTVEDESLRLQYIDYLGRGQYKGTEMTPVIENQIENQRAVDSSGPSRTKRKGNDNIFEQSDEVAEHVTETEKCNKVGKTAKNVQVLAQNRMDINEASPQNQTDLEQMEESNVISNMRTDAKDDQFEDAKGKPEIGATDLPIVTEEFPSIIINHSVTEQPPLVDKVVEANREAINEECLKEDKKDYKCEPEMGAAYLPIVTEELSFKDNQVSTTFSSRVVGVEGNVVDSGMKQNAENEMQQTSPIINQSVTEQTPLEDNVIEGNREDVNEECLKEVKEIIDMGKSQQSQAEENLKEEKHNGSLPSENGQGSKGVSSSVHEKNTCDSPNDTEQVERLKANDLHSSLDDNSNKENEENELQTSAKGEVTDIEIQADTIMIPSDEYCQRKETWGASCINEEENQGEAMNDGSIAWSNDQVGVAKSSSFNVPSERNIYDSLNDDEQGEKLKSYNVRSLFDDSWKHKQEEEDFQASPNSGATERGDKADYKLVSSKEYCQHMESSGGSSINEEENQGEEKRNGSVACNSGQAENEVSNSVHVPSTKNICDSSSDTEQEEIQKWINVFSSSDDSWNEEKEEEGFQSSPIDDATESKEQADSKSVSSDGYCQQGETLRASNINIEENQGDEQQNGLIECNNGQEVKDATNIIHAPLETSICDSPNDAEQGERLKSTNIRSLSDDSWNKVKETDDFQASPWD